MPKTKTTITISPTKSGEHIVQKRTKHLALAYPEIITTLDEKQSKRQTVSTQISEIGING